MIADIPKYWMVHNPGRYGNGQPTVMHDSKMKALDEAKRLAQKNPGENFVVLESVLACRAPAPVAVVSAFSTAGSL